MYTSLERILNYEDLIETKKTPSQFCGEFNTDGRIRLNLNQNTFKSIKDCGDAMYKQNDSIYKCRNNNFPGNPCRASTLGSMFGTSDTKTKLYQKNGNKFEIAGGKKKFSDKKSKKKFNK